jgi:putative flippase GtrA
MFSRQPEPQGRSSHRFARELLGYGLVSVLALAVDMSLLGALVRLGWHYLIASAVGFSVGAVIAYMGSAGLVFRSRRLQSRSLEFACFAALGGIGLLVNAGALFLAVSQAGLNLFTSKLLAAACTFASNFALRRQLLFAPGRSLT